MDKFLHLEERGTSTGQELRAGLTTFLAMAYIVFLNPLILSEGMPDVPNSALVTATCVGAAVMTILMGLISNRPLACASGLGVNSMIATAAVTTCGGDWHAAMGVILLEGVAILILVLCGLREAIMDAIPVTLRHAISVGLGLFIAMIGLSNAGIIVQSGSLIGLGELNNTFAIGVISIVATVLFEALHVKGSILLGILVAVICSIPLGVTAMPTSIVSPLDFSTFGAPFQSDANGVMGIAKVVTDPALLILAFSLMMSDFFDTMGTAMAVAKQGEFLTEDGNVENIKEILIVDSAAAAVGGLVGASSITTFVESTSGAADGGRTGLTSITTGVLFLLAAFFSPIINCVPGAATCGALVYVGYLMMGDVSSINWGDIQEGFPAFMIVAGICMTYSISAGIGFGFIAYVVCAIFGRKLDKIKPLMWVATLAFIVYFLSPLFS
ncbi:NCS2 family permease [Thermophilibacter sp.]